MGIHENWSYAEVFSMSSQTTREFGVQYQPSKTLLVHPWFPPVVAERCHNDPSVIEHYYRVYGDRPSPLEMHKSYPN